MNKARRARVGAVELALAPVFARLPAMRTAREELDKIGNEEVEANRDRITVEGDALNSAERDLRKAIESLDRLIINLTVAQTGKR